jgi:hypothetical protein
MAQERAERERVFRRDYIRHRRSRQAEAVIWYKPVIEAHKWTGSGRSSASCRQQAPDTSVLHLPLKGRRSARASEPSGGPDHSPQLKALSTYGAETSLDRLQRSVPPLSEEGYAIQTLSKCPKKPNKQRSSLFPHGSTVNTSRISPVLVERMRVSLPSISPPSISRTRLGRASRSCLSRLGNRRRVAEIIS